MNFFKNAHVITAMIVAPLLSVGAYFIADWAVKEKPHAMVAGQVYPLVTKPNCRFSSGQCDLQNAAFHARLSMVNDQSTIELRASHAMQSATIGFVRPQGQEVAPAPMKTVDDAGKVWQLILPINASPETIARIALQVNGAYYFAETAMHFGQYQTVFDKDFRRNH